MKTIPARHSELEPKWFVVDASDKVLGRLATKIASIIRGKHRAEYTPHLPAGDCVIVLNANKIKITGKKSEHKIYDRYSGYPSGRKVIPYKRMLATKPEYIVEHAVYGMLPKNRLGRVLKKRLFVYGGVAHPHKAQNPELLQI